jgi:chemotaxis protein CheX
MSTGTAVAKPPQHNWLPILECATQEVFEIMLGCKVELVPPAEQNPKGGFTAIVGIAGALCGVVTVRSDAKTTASIARVMLGDASASEEQSVDAIGEMCNMIAGNFKNKLAGTDERCMLSVPSVISGGEYRFRSLVHGAPIEVVVMFEDAPVVVCLQLKG